MTLQRILVAIFLVASIMTYVSARRESSRRLIVLAFILLFIAVVLALT